MTIERITERRINGQRVTCFDIRDGVQRREWVGHQGDDAAATFGSIYKSRHDACVTARRPDGVSRDFAVFTYGATTDQAFSVARTWLVGSAA